MISQLYRLLLKLHPVPFRVLFEEEMLEVFQQSLQDAQRQNNVVSFYVKEVAGIFLSLLRERNSHFKPMNHHRSARVVLRFSSPFLVLFYFVMNRVLFEASVSYAVFAFFNLLAMLGIVLAFRWERVGGILTLVSIIPIAIWLGINGFMTSNSLFSMAVVIPFYCFMFVFNGAFFMYLSFQKKQKPSPETY
jgi:hypothetical protein